MALFLATATLPSGAEAPDDEVEVTPIARYVSEEPKLRSYSEFNASVAAGTALYDDTFRHPFLPLGRLVVDCRKVRRVGVTLAVRFTDIHSRRVGHRYPTSQYKDTMIKYIWSHSEHPKEGGRYFSSYRVHPHRKLQMVSDGITLREVDLVDGVLSIDIVVNSKSVYQTSFELVGCERAT